ncbi:Zinc finger protein 358 [Anthophora retusa]
MMPMSNIYCLICNINLDVSSCINIFSTSFPRHEESLINFISRVLRIATSELQNPYICSQCYNLFQMLEQAQKTVLNIRCEILKIYRATERRKGIKQSVNNDTKLNLCTNTVLEGKKLNNGDEHEKGGSNLQTFQIEDIVQQQCVQDHVANQNINVPNTDFVGNNKITAESKKHFKRRTTYCNEVDNIKSFDYNNTHVNIKKDEIFKNDVLHNSIALINDNNVYNINTSQANLHALKMHVEENNFFSLIECEKNESKKSITTNSIFSDNNLQVQNADFKWKEVNENITEVKENTENTTVTNVDQIKVPLKSEKISKYDLKPLKYSCPTCDKRWRTSAELKTHIKTHSSLRPYMCEKCGQAYKHKHALEIHVGMHNGINPFQCNFCNKCFTQKGALMRHLPMHTGEMPYQCELCGKRFVHHTSYKMHRLSHTGQKSYKCHICDLSLLSTSHLKRHMRVHTGEKPFSCTICGKRFAERYNLFTHQKIHDPLESKAKKTKEIKYQCNHCNMVFEQKQNLNNHMKYHSTNDESDLNQSQCTILQVEPDTEELSKKVNSEHCVLQQTWIQMNRSKLDIIDNQARFVLLQNPLPEIDEDSFAVAFSEQKVSLESTNYNTNLQVIIEPSDTSLLSNNLSSIDKIHM